MLIINCTFNMRFRLHLQFFFGDGDTMNVKMERKEQQN